jgi:hypothetical protein
MTTTLPTTTTVTLAYAMEDRGLPFLATDGQHYAYGETAEQALANVAEVATWLATVATPDPMADQTTWTTYGVSDAERAAIVAAAAMIGRTFRYRGGGEFSVLGVNDCRPAHNGASVYGTYRYTYRYVRSDGRADDTYNGSTWVADLGAEVVR